MPLQLFRRVQRQVKGVVKQAIISHHRNSGAVLFSDTTLRDGEQMPGATLDPADKLRIALALEEAGVHSLHAGFAASSPSEIEDIRQIVGKVKKPVLPSLSRTARGEVESTVQAVPEHPRHKPGVR